MRLPVAEVVGVCQELVHLEPRLLGQFASHATSALRERVEGREGRLPGLLKCLQPDARSERRGQGRVEVRDLGDAPRGPRVQSHDAVDADARAGQSLGHCPRHVDAQGVACQGLGCSALARGAFGDSFSGKASNLAGHALGFGVGGLAVRSGLAGRVRLEAWRLSMCSGKL